VKHGAGSQRKLRRGTEVAGVNFPAARLDLRQVIVELQAKPKAGGAAKRLLEPHRHLSGNPRPAADHTRKRRASHAQRLSAVRYADA
jgi:hypothetical protein